MTPFTLKFEDATLMGTDPPDPDSKGPLLFTGLNAHKTLSRLRKKVDINPLDDINLSEATLVAALAVQSSSTLQGVASIFFLKYDQFQLTIAGDPVTHQNENPFIVDSERTGMPSAPRDETGTAQEVHTGTVTLHWRCRRFFLWFIPMGAVEGHTHFYGKTILRIVRNDSHYKGVFLGVMRPKDDKSHTPIPLIAPRVAIEFKTTTPLRNRFFQLTGIEFFGNLLFGTASETFGTDFVATNLLLAPNFSDKTGPTVSSFEFFPRSDPKRFTGGLGFVGPNRESVGGSRLVGVNLELLDGMTESTIRGETMTIGERILYAPSQTPLSGKGLTIGAKIRDIPSLGLDADTRDTRDTRRVEVDYWTDFVSPPSCAFQLRYRLEGVFCDLCSMTQKM